MLTIVVPGEECFDDENQEFVTSERLCPGTRALSGLTFKMGVEMRKTIPLERTERLTKKSLATSKQ